MPAGRNVPLLWLGLYKSPRVMTELEVDHWLATHTPSGSYQFTDVTRAWDSATYQKAFGNVQEKIRAGDIYQANLSRHWRARVDEDFPAAALYRRLRQSNPAPGKRRAAGGWRPRPARRAAGPPPA